MTAIHIEDGTTEHEEDISEVTLKETSEEFTTEYIEADDTTLGPLPEQATTGIVESYGDENNEETAIVTQEESISSVETRIVQATGFREGKTREGFKTTTENENGQKNCLSLKIYII